MGEEQPTEGQELELALTRKFLTAMGIEAEKVDQIVEAHGETLNGLKAERDDLRAEVDKQKEIAAKVPALEKKIEDMKNAQPDEDWQAKYDQLEKAKEALQGEFDSYKEEVARKESDAEKLSLYKALLREIGLDEKRVAKAARLKDLSELSVEDGKLVGLDELKASEAEEWADFIPQVNKQGAQVPTPPNPEPGADGPNQRAVEIAKERHERLYGKSEE